MHIYYFLDGLLHSPKHLRNHLAGLLGGGGSLGDNRDVFIWQMMTFFVLSA
jgi:hypothetical protein